MRDTRTETKENLSNFYDRTSHDYHDANYLTEGTYYPLKFRQFYIEKMIDSLKLPLGARILDVGCGPGELILRLLKKDYQVWGVDISPSMVEEAKRTICNGGISGFSQVSTGDIEKLEFEDQFFDVVVASGVLEYQKEDSRSLMEMRRVLKKNGALILNVTNRYSYVTYSENMYFWLKRNQASLSVLNFLNKHIMHRKRLNDFPKRRVHSPAKFDQQLRAFGFKKLAHNYFRFSPLPVPFDSILDFFCGPVGAYMERWTRSRLGFWGGGYLVLCARDD